MQPTYLPWIGYFKLIQEADLFVFLDDVQFARRSWQSRNKILLSGAEIFLTVPVKQTGQRSQHICDTLIDESHPWKRKHLRTITQAYAASPHGNWVLTFLETIFNSNEKNLSILNQKIIQHFAMELGLKTKFICSSELNCSGNKSEKLINILQKVGAEAYLSSTGSQSYIEDEGLFHESKIPVKYQNYNPKEYSQLKSKTFVPFLSIVDLFFNYEIAAAISYMET